MQPSLFCRVALFFFALAASADSKRMFFPQFATVNDIPKEHFQDRKVIYGRVVRIIDGDTIRIRHCRSRMWWLLGRGEGVDRQFDPHAKRIYDSTLSVRIYAVDCPELQKRKSDPPSQPYAEQAKDCTSQLLPLHSMVRVKLLRRDQYGRAVGKVQTSPGLFAVVGRRKDVSMELAERGLAVLYTGGGAEYDGKREQFEKLINDAKREGRGMWSLGSNLVTPAEFKRRQAMGKEEQPVTRSVAPTAARLY